MEKRHARTTYFQRIKLPGERELPPSAQRRRDSYTVLDAYYYCHECIRGRWYVRKEISKELNREDVGHKILREIPEMDDLTKNDEDDDGGRMVPA